MKSVVSSIFRLWPGYSGVVRFGLWDQLAIALLFGAICDLALVVDFLWSDFLSNYSRASVGVGAFVCWIFLGAVAGSRLKNYEKNRDYDASGEAFLEAQTEYLRGNWFEAECRLKATLKRNPFDAEALLLLATLYRHIQRFSEAKKTLGELEKLDAAAFWNDEIYLEKKALQNDERETREEARTKEASPNSSAASESVEPPAETTSEPENPPEVAPLPVSANPERLAPEIDAEEGAKIEPFRRASDRPILKFNFEAAKKSA